jgi:2-dehydro-3-deoxy-D-pentonate aldolase
MLNGIFVPNIAPYLPDGSLNEHELRKIVNWLINRGVSGLYPNGSMGEFIRLSFEERKRIIEIIADETNSRVPILAGAAEPNIDLVLEMCQFCADLGCAAVSITGPYYYKPDQDSIEAYFRDLANKSPIDIVIYNIPNFASEISIPVLRRLALDCPRIVGTKDSSADMCRFLHIINEIKPQRPDFSVLIGWEELMVPALMMGADGGTLSTAGVAPEAIMRIYKETKAENWDEAKRLQFKLLELFQTMLQSVDFPGGFRLGYEARGFNVGRARFPIAPQAEQKLSLIRNKITCLLQECGFCDLNGACNLDQFSHKSYYGEKPISQTLASPTIKSINIEKVTENVMNQLRRNKSV